MNHPRTTPDAASAGTSAAVSPSASPARRSRAVILALDVVLIILFAALGRDTHQHGLDPAGILVTASPFLAACLAGWVLLGRRHSPASLWPAGVALWLITVVAGLGIRALFGGGMALSFAIVTLCVLGAFLLIPRGAALLLDRRRR
ncbi:DUF3054 domain-containing protein [Arthrobacter gengyunqii]|uniref:DUF3054 domain-containing protein n=1 Tax=Arthrobacter gengyunqii TaxID=2886940 RepID=A0A9X1M1H1_9MICC|nr:DUF3054 domain-containing protein [Arthrobacter gengyunqii]MCC3269207.1 DUF3054 domain-containing protein [Arthrobacter gengyunqii]UOY94836.1 DUF3054 domain-containing protein [Arthrobacter gengyunqii]